jgi:hypothetical protein
LGSRKRPVRYDGTVYSPARVRPGLIVESEPFATRPLTVKRNGTRSPPGVWMVVAA